MNLFGMGPMELILILIVALIIFGPGRLPEIMGGIGRAIREFRRMSSEVTREFTQIREELEGKEPQTESQAVAQEVAPAVSSDTQPVAAEVVGEAVPELEAKAVAQEQVEASAQTTVFDESPKTIVFEPAQEEATAKEPEAPPVGAAMTTEPVVILMEPPASSETPKRKRAPRRKKIETEAKGLEN